MLTFAADMQPLPQDIGSWDEAVMERFIAENSSAFHVFVGRFVSDRTMIDDFLQEAYAKLWARRKDIGEVASPRNYFYALLRNVVLDRLSYYRRGLSDIDAERCGGLADEHTFMDTMAETECSRLVAEAIGQLPPQTRDIMLRTLRGEHMAEIADGMGISVNTVKTLKYRAIRRLAQRLSRDDFAVLLLFV